MRVCMCDFQELFDLTLCACALNCGAGVSVMSVFVEKAVRLPVTIGETPAPRVPGRV